MIKPVGWKVNTEKEPRHCSYSERCTDGTFIMKLVQVCTHSVYLRYSITCTGVFLHSSACFQEQVSLKYEHILKKAVLFYIIHKYEKTTQPGTGSKGSQFHLCVKVNQLTLKGFSLLKQCWTRCCCMREWIEMPNLMTNLRLSFPLSTNVGKTLKKTNKKQRHIPGGICLVQRDWTLVFDSPTTVALKLYSESWCHLDMCAVTKHVPDTWGAGRGGPLSFLRCWQEPAALQQRPATRLKIRKYHVWKRLIPAAWSTWFSAVLLII